MIVVQDADEVLARLWAEIRQEPGLADLVGILPRDRDLNAGDAISVLMMVIGTPVLKGSERQLAVIDALGHAYARARGLHFVEE